MKTTSQSLQCYSALLIRNLYTLFQRILLGVVLQIKRDPPVIGSICNENWFLDLTHEVHLILSSRAATGSIPVSHSRICVCNTNKKNDLAKAGPAWWLHCAKRETKWFRTRDAHHRSMEGVSSSWPDAYIESAVSQMLYARVLFFCEVNKNKNAKEYLCLGLLRREHACKRSCLGLVKSWKSSDVASWV